MTPRQESTQLEKVSQTEFHELLRQKLREAVRYTLIEVLEAEEPALEGRLEVAVSMSGCVRD